MTNTPSLYGAPWVYDLYDQKLNGIAAPILFTTIHALERFLLASIRYGVPLWAEG